MSQPAISVQGISKLYRIGQKAQENDTLREVLVKTFTDPVKNLKQLIKLTRFNYKDQVACTEKDIIFALYDVSFEVHEGEVLGIIGRNGAGKTTLLKILSRIIRPTWGKIAIRGRITSLLEIGTGFHPELTGRENIYMNGSILGMKRREIREKFDEIVAFSGVEKFLDTPVKRYSSGMYVRLAFAVAAHLEQDILLVDEVLAVGDIPFQQKCLDKLSSVAREGKTVVFVSHEMGYIRNLCSRTILIERGRLQADDITEKSIDTYMKLVSPDNTTEAQRLI